MGSFAVRGTAALRNPRAPRNRTTTIRMSDQSSSAPHGQPSGNEGYEQGYETRGFESHEDAARTYGGQPHGEASHESSRASRDERGASYETSGWESPGSGGGAEFTERADRAGGEQAVESALDGGFEARAEGDGPARRRRGRRRGGRGRRRGGRAQGEAASNDASASDPARQNGASEGLELDEPESGGEQGEDSSPAISSEERAQAAPGAEGERNGARRRGRRRGGRRRRGGARGDSPEAHAHSNGRAGEARVEAGAEAPELADGLESEQSSEVQSEQVAAGAETGRRSKRGRRGGRSRNRKQGSERGGARAPEGAPKGNRRSGGQQGPVVVEALPGEDDDLPELNELPSDAQLLAPERARADEDEELAPREQVRDQVIVVNAADTHEARVAVVQGAKIVDLQMTVEHHQTLVNDIYRGRIVNIESAIGAAFVDFGQGRNGFLHSSDVMSVYGDPEWSIDKLLTAKVEDDEWDDEAAPAEGSAEAAPEEGGEVAERGTAPEGRARGGARRRGRTRQPVTDLLRKGQLVVVQVTKDAIGDKGPTLTTYISIPGRYLVLMPCMAKTGVSRKIDDEKERRRLRKILESMEIPGGMGVIVRTAGIGKARLELERDLKYLLATWETFERRLKRGTNPAPLYQESDVAIRTMRDLFSTRTEKVVVDNQAVYDHMLEFTRELMPEHVERIQLHTGARPLFHDYGVEQDFERIFARRVELPSGGSIVIDQTEALVAIDVNSGRTREEGADFEDIALKTNLEAVAEITRQIRLRDLGGIIVCDFIDMMRASGRRSVERALRDALVHDRARSKIGRISQFGLIELTRQRLGPGLSKLLYDTCPHCKGSGRLRTSDSRAQAILRRVSAAMAQKGFSTIDVHARPEIIDSLNQHCGEQLERMRQAHPQKELRLTSVPDQAEDGVLRYLRADGREVRPGGRRRK